jgi:amidophosphoribosyltransferase
MAYLGLYAQQHRGQEGAGVVSLDHTPEKPEFHVHKGLGLVAEVFEDYDFAKLPGSHAIGHARYTTAGGNFIANVQPFFAEVSCGNISIAHNGNLINADAVKAQLTSEGSIFSSTSDTEVILHLIARAPAHTPRIEAVINALQHVKGAYSLVILFDDRLLAIRDPNGFRPLCIGALNGATVVASETCALDLLGARYVRDVQPGEIVEITKGSEMKSYFPFGINRESPCIFEYVYFARPDSSVFGRNVYPVRKRLGHELAIEHPAKADYVIAVPDSGVPAALGFAEESKIPYEMGLVRNHYVGRTFIEPQQSIRDFGVRIKLNANGDLLRGKSIVVVDDSIVRGTTSKKIVAMLRRAGAREVHLRISAPPTIDPCFYGIDTPDKEDLIASHKSVEEIREFIGVNSLGFLSLEGLYRAVSSTRGKFCDACFTGEYPIGIPESFKSKQLKLL